MGKRITKQFEQRFKGGIEMHFVVHPLSPSEQGYRNECLRKAALEIFRAVFGHEPTQEELTGQVDISLNKGILRRKKTLR